MILINTIEVAAYDYAKEEYEYPNTTSELTPYERNNFWLKCISDSNLGGLQSIYKGSYFVDIDTINLDELSEILKKELRDIDVEDFKDQVGQLCGGVAVELNDEIVIEPSCCGDLGNLSGWENIFNSEIGMWQQLWIGHPWVFYRRINDHVEFSEYSDLNLEDFKNIKTVHTVSETELAEEVKRIRKAQYDFADKIHQALTAMKIENAKDISQLMISAA